jgi:malate dehydrogenase (quinone)
MIDVVGRCFKEELASEWQEKIKKMIPSHGQDLNDNPRSQTKLEKYCYSIKIE